MTADKWRINRGRGESNGPRNRLKKPATSKFLWWPGAGSNRRPSAFQVGGIATDLWFICVCASYAPH